MTDTNTSGADVLATMDAELRLMKYRHFSTAELERHCDIRAAVAALIEREAAQAKRIAELEADIEEYSNAVNSCEGGNLCRCSIVFIDREEARNG